MEAAEYAALTAVDLRDLVVRRETSAGEVVEAALGRLAEIDPLVRAFTDVRAAEARLTAREIDRWLMGGSSGERLRLAGVPIGVKKSEGVYAPQPQRLMAQGCVVLGTTSVPLPATSWQTWGHTDRGPTRNPWLPTVVAGGSSAGSAVAVATGIVPLATGSDGAGSVRIPAAWCGIVGLKTTNGLLLTRDRAGLTAPGPLARTVADAAAYLDVVAGTDTFPRLGDEPAGLRACWSDTLGFITCDPDIAYVVRQAAHTLAVAGVLRMTTVSVQLRDPGDAWHALRGKGDRNAARHTRRYNDVRLAELFSEVDLLLTPTTPVPPHGHEGPGDAMTVDFTWAFNLSGHPAVSVPAGCTPDGLPVGLQLVAPHGKETLLLRTAAALERRMPWPQWTPAAWTRHYDHPPEPGLSPGGRPGP